MNIITGYTGTPHITSAQDRDGNQGCYGTGSYILDVGTKMSATIVSANEIRINDGALSHQGCLGNIDSGQYDSLAISNGSQGMQRSDLIVCRYEKASGTNIESLSLVVIEGVPAASNPTDPSYYSGNIHSGDSPVDFPLYRVNINGISITSVTRLAPYVRTQAETDTLLGDSVLNTSAQTLTGAIVEHENDINTIRTATNSSVSLETGWTSSTNWCRKRNGTCEIYLEVTGGTLASGWNTIGTIPSGYSPVGAHDFVCVDNGNSTNPAAQCKITTAGLIQIYKLSGTTNNLRIHDVFVN